MSMLLISFSRAARFFRAADHSPARHFLMEAAHAR